MLKDVEVLEARQLEWVDTYAKPEAADVAAQQEVARVKAEYTREGFMLVTEEILAGFEEKWREQRDRDGTAAGSQLEMDRALLAQRLADAVREQECLKAPPELHGVTTERYLLSSILDELQTTRAQSEVSGLTRFQLADQLETWKDDADNAKVRLVEAAVTAGTVSRLGLRDDPETDAIGAGRLQKAVAARRLARVPAELVQAAARLEALTHNATFDVTLRHLRAGRGVALRPKPLTMQVA